MKSAVSAPGVCPVRSGALRGALGDEFCSSPYRVRESLAAWTGLMSDRLNALMKPTATTRPLPLAFVEADATPETARVGPALVVPQQSLRARSASKASAAR